MNILASANRKGTGTQSGHLDCAGAMNSGASGFKDRYIKSLFL